MRKSPLNKYQQTDALPAPIGPASITSILARIDAQSIYQSLASTLLAVTLMISFVSVQAGDEDLNPSVYQDFDPVTGFVIDVVPPPDDQQAAAQNHAASTSATPPPVASTPATSAVTPEPETSSGLNPLLLTGGILVLGLVGAVAISKRKGAGH
jgi:hypothetical protein